MEYRELDIPDVVVLEPKVFSDERGAFFETFRDSEFRAHCGEHNFVQDNHSVSACGVLRGIHYQLNRPQGKLVRVVRGAVFDVAVDLRRSSPTFGAWVGVTLDTVSHNMLWVPPGFGHAFLSLEDGTEFVYKCTDYYDPGDERSLVWNDARVGIDWPSIRTGRPIVSSKDASAPGLDAADTFD
jgi:dTDP-4-dehydrorhamnose 3,5-epimerase